jgi:hypothetical protein
MTKQQDSLLKTFFGRRAIGVYHADRHIEYSVCNHATVDILKSVSSE